MTALAAPAFADKWEAATRQTSIAELHYQLGKALDRCGLPLAIDPNRPRHNPNVRMLGGLQIDAVVRPVSPPPTDVDPVNCARIEAEWQETDRLIEAARVKHGMGSPAFRTAWRAIIDRPSLLDGGE